MVRPHLKPRIDKDLARYLIRGERLVHPPVRQHWVSQSAPIAMFLGALVVAAWIDVVAPGSPQGRFVANIGWLGAALTGGWLAWRLFNWRNDWFVATDKRFLLFEGFLSRRVSMMPLVKVTDLTFNRSVPGRFLGYGTFKLESAGQEQALSDLDFLPHADALYRDICTELFGDSGPTDPEDQWPDDGWPGDRGPGDWPGDRGPGDWPDDRSPWGTGPRPGWVGEPRSDPSSRQHSPVVDGEIRRPRRGRRDGDGHLHDDPTRAQAHRHDAVRPRGESIYRSADLARDDDTAEIPVVPARPLPPRRPDPRTAPSRRTGHGGSPGPSTWS